MTWAECSRDASAAAQKPMLDVPPKIKTRDSANRSYLDAIEMNAGETIWVRLEGGSRIDVASSSPNDADLLWDRKYRSVNSLDGSAHVKFASSHLRFNLDSDRVRFLELTMIEKGKSC